MWYILECRNQKSEVQLADWYQNFHGKLKIEEHKIKLELEMANRLHDTWGGQEHSYLWMQPLLSTIETEIVA